MSSDERTPRSGRVKKKNALSRLAARSKRSGNESTDGSMASLAQDSEESIGRRPVRKYPIDARVEVTPASQSGLSMALEDDSDEGIEMATSSYDSRHLQGHMQISDGPLDKMRNLNMENEDRSYLISPFSHKGEKRFHEQTSSGDECKAQAKTKKYPGYLSKRSASGSEEISDETNSDRKSELCSEYTKLSSKTDSTDSEGERDAQRHPTRESRVSPRYGAQLRQRDMADSEETSHRESRVSPRYGAQLRQRDIEDSDETGHKAIKSRDSDSDEDYNPRRTDNHVNARRTKIMVMEAPMRYSSASRDPEDSLSSVPVTYTNDDILHRYKEMLSTNDSREDRLDALEQAEINDSLADMQDHRRFPEPAASNSPMPAHHGVGRANVFGSYDRPWLSGNPSGMFDVMSQRSYQSSSVLPLISTKEAKGRSFLVGSINSRCSLLGTEELERYFPDRKMRVFVGTWNMAEIKEVPENMDEFLLPDSCDYVQDVYVISTQESCPNRREWEIKLQETLGPQHVLFHSAALGVLYLTIFLRRDLIWFCSVAEEDSVSTRAGPTHVKTKGAVGVSFTFFGTSFLFINCHMSPHDGKVKERIADYQKICKSLRLPKQAAPKQYITCNDDVTNRFDCVFWAGDLNFRIGCPRDHVDSAVQGITSQEFPDYDDLVTHDELFKARNDGLAFQEFQEGRISFMPTYKFDPGTEKYDSSKKLRVPSYTDRVLFRTRKKNSTVCLHYDAVPTITQSDHRPVYSMFEVNIRPGRDNIPLAAGQFNREVWLEGARRRQSRSMSVL